MKTINAFKTTDGEIFEDHNKAKNHQNNIDLRTDLEKFLDNKDTGGDFDEQLIDLAIENRKELIDILTTSE